MHDKPAHPLCGLLACKAYGTCCKPKQCHVTTIPAGTDRDAEKRGPWIKLTWDETAALRDLLFALDDDPVLYERLEPLGLNALDGVYDKLEAELASRP